VYRNLWQPFTRERIRGGRKGAAAHLSRLVPCSSAGMLLGIENTYREISNSIVNLVYETCYGDSVTYFVEGFYILALKIRGVSAVVNAPE
jgi:hypothetical protein